MINYIGFPYQSNPNPRTELDPAQKKLHQACADFETMMVKKMLEAMTGGTKMFGTGFSGDFYQSMFQDAIAEAIAKQGIGIGKLLYRQLAHTEEKISK
jgi:Rod binding domain-containing protein